MQIVRRTTKSHEFFLFLVATFLVRAFHILQWPQIVWGMNHATAGAAKHILTGGLSDAYLPVPALPSLVVAAITKTFGVTPGDTIIPLTLLVCMLYASAFWLWINSLRVPMRIVRFAAFAFLFLPYHNSYTGLGSLQTASSCTLAVLFAALVNRYLVNRNRRELIIACLVAATLPWIRSEYCLLIPMHLAMVLPAHYLVGRKVTFRRAALVLGSVLLAIVLGVFTAIAMRASLWGETNLVPPRYSCWTFLDGMPAKWLTPEDDSSEFNRRLVGIQHFGHPADFDYSLGAMVMNSPGKTLSKFVLSIPRWLNQISHRDQVVPRPAAMLALLGLLFLLRYRQRKRRLLLAAQALSLIFLTVPVIAIMIHAEYLAPVFSAEVMLMGYGALAVVTIAKRLWRPFPAKLAYLFMAVCLCAGMQYLYFRSGANLKNQHYYKVIGGAVDDLGHADGLLIEPYWALVDANCKVTLLNRTLQRQHFAKHGFGRLPPAPLDVWSLAEEFSPANLRGVVVWSETKDNTLFLEHIKRWSDSGFEPQETQEISDGDGRTLYIVYCQK